MTQRWQKVSVAAFGEHDVWVVTFNHRQHLLQTFSVIE
jgi:hypothetical protein